MLRIGTSGWQYRHWRGVLYPESGPPRAWFDAYAGRFDTVEINATFYRLPAAATFESWARRAPEGFLYALKFSKYGSHLKRLLEPEATIGAFVERARLLGPALGPVLVQLPPRWNAVPARLDAFLAAAPREMRWALEFRDPSWLVPEVLDILRRHEAALCVHDKIPGHPQEATADWVYLRYHGRVPGGRYGTRRLRAEARRIEGWMARGLDVYAYFNNDPHGHAVRDALQLEELMAGRAGSLSARRSRASRTPG
ncbi:MAG: DUF72 domain-containing protein [Candidatus Polarisedimenticolia bacterium]